MALEEDIMEQNNEPIKQEEIVNNPQPQHIGYALTSFILSFLGVVFAATIVGCVPGMVFGIIGLAYANKCQDVTRKPFIAFKRIAKPFSIVSIVVGAVATTALIVTGLVFAIIAIVKHVS